jgi:hypothetical protein
VRRGRHCLRGGGGADRTAAGQRHPLWTPRRDRLDHCLP